MQISKVMQPCYHILNPGRAQISVLSCLRAQNWPCSLGGKMAFLTHVGKSSASVNQSKISMNSCIQTRGELGLPSMTSSSKRCDGFTYLGLSKSMAGAASFTERSHLTGKWPQTCPISHYGYLLETKFFKTNCFITLQDIIHMISLCSCVLIQ